MYLPKQFKMEDPEQLQSLIKAHPLATLICTSDAGLEANHLPMLVEEHDGERVLIAHIAKANPLHKNIANGSEVLAVFQGPQAYISASYYPSKREDPRVVPTWNYTAIHIKGRIEFIHDKAALLNIVRSLTDAQESQREHPWKVSDAPREYIDKMLNAIVGLEISINDIQGKWKVSQNQNNENRQGVSEALHKSNSKAMAQEVSAYKK